ncbi:1,6-anhydro-N-acetylmuramyl-L-alanine amidase AmpD [Hahella ganghwensis]|uniref:1,6-anhydro-N-acetylmuramyl-L-alanine amidase AmpD n=1 Tax=Hahella ganghwensis TaxID=286420 RepID=UPI00036B6F1C|nr:1,6-anhydro-N-acetylmuramyl-L-alanine amidase AmpD [Hahella ganghwensis]
MKQTTPTETEILSDGWFRSVRRVESPNYNRRPEGRGIDMIVVHNISLPPGQFGGPHIEQFFQNNLDRNAHPYFRDIAGMEVSAHFLIRRNGELVQFVSVNDRAWHAGKSCWEGEENCNDFSIGIELEGTDDTAYEEAQYQQLAGLIRCLKQHFPAISESRIVGHSDIAPGRKTDPGNCFEWPTLKSMLKNN